MERPLTLDADEARGKPANGRGSLEPSAWVTRYLHGIKAGGLVADVACGRGRHLRLALARGYRALAVDRDLSLIADLDTCERLERVEADLEGDAPFPLAGRRFDGVIVTDYLWRPILPDIAACVAADGVLLYETFAAAHAVLGMRPGNPDFLLRPNELLEAFSPSLSVIAYETAHLPPPRERIVQRIVAVGPRHPWVSDPPPSAVPT